MTLTILNNEFVPIVLIDDFNSFIWTDRYNTIGDFELIVPYKEEYNFLLNLTKTDKYYLQCSLSEHLMFIKKIQISYDPEDGYLIQLEGLSLESILEQRIIFPQTILTGSLHNGIKKLITNNVISPYNPDIEGPTANRQISNFIFVDSTDQTILDLQNRSQYTGDNLYETISQLCQLYGLGFKVLLNQSTGNFEFSLYRGEDRSFGQDTNPYVLFTPKLENLNSMERITDYSGYKNAFWAAGEDAAEDRVNIYTVSDENPDTVSGLDLKEIYVDARDIQNQDGEITDEDYYTELKKRGSEKLSEYSITTAISGEVQYKTNFEYNVDYFIGDIVQLDDGLGNQSMDRITEQIISYNKEGLSLYPTFTQDHATTSMSSGGSGVITRNEYYTKQEVNDLLADKVSKSGDTMTGALTMAGRDINLKTTGSSSNDSGDIVWYYGNGQEKARLWTEDAYTSESGLNFRMYKEDGTSLFSGTIPLRNNTYNFNGTTFYSGNSNTAEHNCNDAIKNGNYYYTSNGPATSIGASTSDGALYVQSYSDIWVAQIAQDYRNGRLFVRGKNNGTWQSWNKVANSSDLDSYVAKSGDTMSGSLTFSEGAVQKAGGNISWIKGRDAAPVKTTSGSANWNPVASAKSVNGSWEIGTLSDTFYFSYATDTNYNKGTNTTNTISLASSGNFSGNSLHMQVPRVAKSCNYQPGKNLMVIEEYTSGASYNLPSNAWYHIFTSEGSDANYACQLALGMTTSAAYYRRYAGSWTAWQSIINTNSGGTYKSIWNTNLGVNVATNPSDSTSIGLAISNAATFRSNIGAQAALSTTTTTPAGAALAKYGNVVWLPIWGVKGNNIGTIPAAYRPKVPCRNLIYCIVGSATYIGIAEVNTSGVFKCWYYKTYGGGSSTDGTNANTTLYGGMNWITA